MAKIHPLATVHPDAKLGENVEVGPYAYIEEHVEIGDGCRILPHATIFNYVKMGRNCTVFPGAVIGAVPQDLKFDGEITYVEIGDNVNIRECATINRGTKASGRGVTKIGNNVLLMSYTHVAHDCTVGNNCILVSYVGIAGETDVDDWATKAEVLSHISSQGSESMPSSEEDARSTRMYLHMYSAAVIRLLMQESISSACVEGDFRQTRSAA